MVGCSGIFKKWFSAGRRKTIKQSFNPPTPAGSVIPLIQITPPQDTPNSLPTCTTCGKILATNAVDVWGTRTNVKQTHDHQSSDPKLIFSCKLDELNGKCLDLEPYVAPQRYRFLTCRAFWDESRLDIVEFSELPVGNYCAVSYVWRGVPITEDDMNNDWNFSVKDAEDGDPISTHVLENIVWTALDRRKSYVWLDRISICQSSKADKSWQIKQMYNIYAGSTCIIIPGGIGRLVTLDEKTSWMDRAWTMQEALGPPAQDDVVFLFLSDPESAMEIELRAEAQFCAQTISATLPIWRSPDSGKANGLKNLAAHRHKTCGYAPFQLVLMSLFRQEVQPFGFHRAHTRPMLYSSRQPGVPPDPSVIWQSALMRTSSRPVDMIFSIMHFFGVSLNPGEFEADDRLGATIALAQGILAKPGNEGDHWMGMLYFLTPSPQLSAFPQFPETSVDGGAFVRLHDGKRHAVADIMSEKLGQLSYVDGKLLRMTADREDLGSMSDDGYYTFTARFTFPLVYSSRGFPPDDYPGPPDIRKLWTPGADITSADGAEWKTQNCDLSSETLGIYLGEVSYPDGLCDLFIIVKKHGENRHHRITYFALPRAQEYERKRIDEQPWITCVYYGVSISIGGPEEIPRRKARGQI